MHHTTKRPTRSSLESPRLLRFASGLVGLGLLALGSSCGNGGSGGGGSVESAAIELQCVRFWNRAAINGSGLDHTPSNQGPTHTFGQQVGPCRSSRAMAIVHIATFEAINAIKGGHASYIGLPAAEPNTSLRAAVCMAAHDTLVALYPSQAAIFADYRDDELAGVGNGAAKDRGVALGSLAAELILALRDGDGSDHPEPRYGIEYVAGDAPGEWRQDPVSQHPLALGAHWDQVAPFVLESPAQFLIPPPPALASAAYALAFDEVKVLGGDGETTPTLRSSDQTEAGIYWAYDGMPSLCAPPRLYNQIAEQIGIEQGLDAIELARLLALVNVAMADAGSASWHSKYFYKVWRPVTAIREADAGTGPSGLGDGNPATVGDVTFTPLGAPGSNTNGPNFTPPFPAYPSGHATFGGALFQTLRRFFETDEIAFTFVSDEFNGVTLDNEGEVRPLLPRSFEALEDPEEENGQSRIYLGIHWNFDKVEGIEQGRNVGNYVFDRLFAPVK